MSSTIQVKITLSGRAANKLLYVLKIYPFSMGHGTLDAFPAFESTY